MIYDTFEHLESCFSKENPIYKALSFAREFDPSRPDGRYEIEDDRMYALVSSYETSPAEARRFEAHRRYIDVQLLLEGEERIEVSLESNLKPLQEYSETKDVIFLDPPRDRTSLVMKPGYFAIFFPRDVHRPKCDLQGKRNVRKMVLKVRVE